jgi:tRNA (guanine-N7-)-methyltransferase
VIAATGEMSHDLRFYIRVQRRTRDDFLEQIGGNTTRAGEGHQTSPRSQQFEPQKIDVLIRTRGFFGMVCGWREFGWIKNDEVELLVHVTQFAQSGEYIRLPEFGARSIDRVRRNIALGGLQRGAGTVNREHRLRATQQGRHAHAAGVAEAVEYIGIARQRACEGAIVALIEIKPGLVAACNVNKNFHAVFHHRNLARKRRTSNVFIAHWQTLERAHVRIGALVNGFNGRRLKQNVRKLVTPRFHTSGQNLQHRDIRIPIHNHTGQQIGFGMNQPHRVSIRMKRRAPRDRLRDAPPEKRVINRFLLLKRQHARGDLGLCTECRRREIPTVLRLHTHDVATLGKLANRASRLDRARKNPRMPPQQGFFAPALDDDFFHAAILRAHRTLPTSGRIRGVAIIVSVNMHQCSFMKKTVVETGSAAPLHRPIRSYVLRQGRLSSGQSRAVEALSPQFVVPFAAGMLNYADTFGRLAPTIVEIGFGMGHTTADVAATLADRNFIGIEVHTPGVGSLLKMIGERALGNVRIVQHDAVEVLQHMIPEASLAAVHIFFPDPWPKKRHHKRRLIQPDFVRLLTEKLLPGGYIHLATDWQEYAEQMLDVLRVEPMLRNSADDFATRPAYRTESNFERKGLAKGHGVWDLVFNKI